MINTRKIQPSLELGIKIFSKTFLAGIIIALYLYSWVLIY
jgi:hypothetical protein